MRIARDFGTVSQLVPEPLTLVDAPHTMVSSIKMALVFLSWGEHLSKEDRPPKRIWLDDDLLNEHFEALDRKHTDNRDGRYANNPEGWRGDPVDNDAAKMLIAE